MRQAIALALGQKIVVEVLKKGGTLEQVHALMGDDRLFGELVSLVCVLKPLPEKLPVAHFRVHRPPAMTPVSLDVFTSVSREHARDMAWRDVSFVIEQALSDTDVFFTLHLKHERWSEADRIAPANVAAWATQHGYRFATRDEAVSFVEYCRRERVLSYADKSIFVPGSVHRSDRDVEVFPVLRVNETGEVWHLESCRGDRIRQQLVLLVRI